MATVNSVTSGSGRRKPKRAGAVQPESIDETVRRLEVDNRTIRAEQGPGFTCEQLAPAVSMLRTRAPNIEILCLWPWFRETILRFKCSLAEASDLIGPLCLPRPPRRVNRITHPWFLSVNRIAAGRVEILANIKPNHAGPPSLRTLATLTVDAIRAVAPLSRLRCRAPDTPEAWKTALLDDVGFWIDLNARFGRRHLSDPSLVGVRSSMEPSNASRADRDLVESLIRAANERFELQGNVTQHVLALYHRLHDELRRGVLAAVRAAAVIDHAAPRLPLLRLAVDNTKASI